MQADVHTLQMKHNMTEHIFNIFHFSILMDNALFCTNKIYGIVLDIYNKLSQNR